MVMGMLLNWNFEFINGLNSTGNLSQNIPSSLQFTYPQCGEWAIRLTIEFINFVTIWTRNIINWN